MAEVQQQLKESTGSEVPAIKSSEEGEQPIETEVQPVLLEKDNVLQLPSDQLVLPDMDSLEKMDELTSLEREIAEMHQHHVDPSAPVVAQRVSQGAAEQADNDEADRQAGKVLFEMQPASRKSTPASLEDALGNGQAVEEEAHVNDILANEELIAVLKGIDCDVSEETGVPTPQIIPQQNQLKDDLVEGVTIEGEGEFQVLEVIDDESDDVASRDGEQTAAGVDSAQKSPSKYVAAVSKMLNKPVTKMTREEERAMAMEQIEGLKSVHADRQRRRKQDMKPLQVETQDLISSLGADWSDDEAANEGGTPAAVQSASNTATASVSNVSPKNSVGNAKQLASVESASHTEAEQQKGLDALPKVTSVVMLQSSKSKTIGSKKNVDNSAAPGGQTSNRDKVADKASTSQMLSGFKRTRIIKRKIIWDPDAPETQFSYATLVRNKSNTVEPKAAKAAPPTPAPTKALAPQTATNSAITIKKESPVKKARPATPKAPKQTATAAEAGEKKQQQRAATPSQMKTAATTPTTTNVEKIPKHSAEEGTNVGVHTAKRRSQTPVANGSAIAKKKKVSEIDRLMGDEGAVNMLNSLESERHKLEVEEQGDKPHKPLMRSRAATISERLIKRDNQVPAAKKDPSSTKTTNATNANVSVPTVKNKRGQKAKPSATWDYVYKQQASEDAMIIRRRSNSSYSSTASQHRLSLDGPIPPKVSKGMSNSAAAAPASAAATAAATSTSGTKTGIKHAMTLAAAEMSAGNSKQAALATGGKTFEFAKPENKAQQKGIRTQKSPSQTSANNQLTSDMKKANSTGRRASRSPANVEGKEKHIKSPPTVSKDDSATSAPAIHHSDVVVKKTAKVAQIIFNTHKAKLNFTFTVQMMNKLVDILDELAVDNDCNAVVMVTNAPHFCQGIDVTDLTLGSTEKRKNAAVQMAAAVKNYLKTLATFPKPLIAGVNGHNIGLGVMQLPLFDVVIASDKGSYETPYAKLGQVPEGFCIWNNITKIRSIFKTKLFWLCEKLHPTESALSGLVNKLSPSSKVNDDALSTAKKIATMSAESYRFMKKATIQNHLEAVVTALDEEFGVIIKQWTSAECHENLKKYLEAAHL